MSELTDRYMEEFKDKETRHIYADNFLNTFIATQLKVLREDRGWTQSKLAQEAGMKQERISVLEDVNYESWSLKTLKRFAKAFDLRLSVKFETFGSFLRDFDSFDRKSLGRVSFDNDPSFHASRAVESFKSTAAVAGAYRSSSRHLPISQLSLGFVETKASEAYGTPMMPIRDIQVSGQPSNNVFSIKTKRPLSQKRKSSRLRKIA